MKIKCRARVSPNCYDNRVSCVGVYGEDSMEDDGLFDGETVVCDPCYITIGQPSLPMGTPRKKVIAHIDNVITLFKVTDDA